MVGGGGEDDGESFLYEASRATSLRGDARDDESRHPML